MARLDVKTIRKPFDWAIELESDKDQSTVVINVGKKYGKLEVESSLHHVTHEVNRHLTSTFAIQHPTKLYIIGTWKASSSPELDATEANDEEHAQEVDEYTLVDVEKGKDRKGKLKQDLKLTTPRIATLEEEEWTKGVSEICELIKSMQNLKEVTWISTLAFTEAALNSLPRDLTKLVIDVSHPVGLDTAENNLPIYIKQENMSYLPNLTRLQELRILGMRDSFQLIIWQTVYQNSHFMRVLDLQMAVPPVIRHKGWVKAENVRGLLEMDDASRITIRGDSDVVNHSGHLDNKYGTGEYLDRWCMEKAGPVTGTGFKLQCLRLDGFVVDHEPFDRELIYTELIVLGENCIDAGLRPPSTTRGALGIPPWPLSTERGVNARCTISWPGWTGVFDAAGNLIDEEKDEMEEVSLD